MEWLMNNWLEVFAAVTGVVTAASLIAKLTPTPKDDEVVAKIMTFINMLALNKK